MKFGINTLQVLINDSSITNFAIYIDNQKNHFEPVTQLEFSKNPSIDIGRVGICIVVAE